MTYLATSNAALCFGFAGSKRREVIVEQEAVGALDESFVDDLLVTLRTEGDGRERLCLAAGEDRRTVRSGQRAHLAPDRADLGCCTSVQTLAFVEHGATHSFLLYIVVVAVNHSGYVVHLDAESLGTLSHILGFLGLEVFADLREHCLAVVLVGVSAGSLCVCAGITEVVHCLLQFVVVHLVAVLAFNLLAILLHHLDLCLALGLDSLVSGADSVQHNRLGHLFHLAFNHHNVVQCGGNHQLEVGALALLEGRVDNKLSVNAGYTYLGYRSLKRYIRARQCCRGSQTGYRLRHIYTVSRIHRNVDKRVCVVVSGEERTERTINEACNQDLVVRCFAFAAGKASGKTSCGGKLLFVLNRQRHKVCTGHSVFGGAYCGKDHGVAQGCHHGSVCLLGELAGLKGDNSTIRQSNLFSYNIHYLNLFRSVAAHSAALAYREPEALLKLVRRRGC